MPNKLRILNKNKNKILSINPTRQKRKENQVKYPSDFFQSRVVLHEEGQILVADVHVTIAALFLVLLDSGATTRVCVFVDLGRKNIGYYTVQLAWKLSIHVNQRGALKSPRVNPLSPCVPRPGHHHPSRRSC